jgi:hypothetical protein
MRIRNLAPVALGAAIVCVGGAGIASAANGGAVGLGQHNTATQTTTIKSKHGPALSLQAHHGPALKVNSTKLIPKLNAQLLDGKSATQIATPIEELGQFTDFGGFLKCPRGTQPIGGGVLPDPTGADDSPFISVTFPHVASNNKTLDGWEGVAGDADGTYDGQGLVYVTCSRTPSKLGAASLSPAALGRAERSHAMTLAMVRARHQQTVATTR